MLGWALTFFILAVIAAYLGFFVMAGLAAAIAKFFLLVFVILLVVSGLMSALRGEPSA